MSINNQKGKQKVKQESKKKSKINSQDIILILIYIVYFLFMAKILLFKNVPPSEVFGSDREISRTIALVPFDSILKYYNSGNLWASMLNVVGNVVIFIPFGVYLMLYSKKYTGKSAVFIVFITSLLVEVTQFVLDIGIADVDDIILNVIGGLIGVWVYKFLKLIFRDENKVKGALIAIVALIVIIYIGLMVYASSQGIRVKLI